MLLFQYPFMLTALALCLCLAGIFGAFGHHVVRRGVIFVDLAMAQSAALGVALAQLLGFDEGRPVVVFAFSLGAAFMTALLFAWFRSRRRVPIEALIGIAYAGAMAVTLILLERAAAGTEELKEMLAGSILTVSRSQLAVVAAASATAAILLWAARKPIFEITGDADAARARGRHVASWDLYFYSMFGLVVSVAVRAVGVLLVFAFLVAPALASMILPAGAAGATWKRLAFGWAFGAAGSLLGLEASLRLDWSAGPTVVATLIALLALTGAIAAARGSRAG